MGWSGGATGDGTGTGSDTGSDSPAYATAVQVQPVDYNGTTEWETAGYYKGGDTDDYGYCLPTVDDPTAGIGDPCRYYLGAPWLTPTAAQWLTLIGDGGANTNKDFPLTVNGTALSFSASSCREPATANIRSAGSACYYWSSSLRSATFGYDMVFNGTIVNPKNPALRLYGLPVRCVSPK